MLTSFPSFSRVFNFGLWTLDFELSRSTLDSYFPIAAATLNIVCVCERFGLNWCIGLIGE